MNTTATSATTRKLKTHPVVLAALVATLGMGLAHAATDGTESKAQQSVDRAVDKTERVVSDSWITTKVKSEIFANSATKGLDVSVKTLHGNVMLTGKLSSKDAIDQVKTIAAKVQGVKSVDTSGLVVG